MPGRKRELVEALEFLSGRGDVQGPVRAAKADTVDLPEWPPALEVLDQFEHRVLAFTDHTDIEAGGRHRLMRHQGDVVAAEYDWDIGQHALETGGEPQSGLEAYGE